MVVQTFIDWKGKPINKEKHGGARAPMFIYFLVAMSNMAIVSNTMNMVTYLHNTMHLDLPSSSTAVTNFIGATCAFALLGGFLSDSYITRFKAILICGPLEFLGFALLALQAHLTSLRPPSCDMSEKWSNCKQVNGYNAALLYIALYITAFGEGCLRANLPSFGGNQFDENDITESKLKSSFFNWFTMGISVGSLIGLILIVWIENNRGWDEGFALSAGVVLVGILVLASGFPYYRHQIPSGSPLTRVLQVFIVAFKKRKLPLPENEEELHQDQSKDDANGTELLPHTKGCRWLDKASILYGTNNGSWSLCTVTQVEETKIVLRMLPIFISAVIGYVPIPQLLTLTVQQGSQMNTKLGSIHVSPASLLIIPIIFQVVLLVVYDRFLMPLARRIKGSQTGITYLQRVGVGFISNSLATCVAAVIERKRKKMRETGSHETMSVMWLGLQFLALGITDVFTFVGLLEFFNSEASRGMKSMGTAIFWCVLGLASLIGSGLVDVVNKATRHGGEGEMGWLEGNDLNKNHLERFYWLLSILGFVGFLNYLYWAKTYVYRQRNLTSTS